MTWRAAVAGHMPGGEEWQNVLHFAGAFPTVEADFDAAMDRIQTFYEALEGYCHSGWGVDEVRCGEADGPVLRVESLSGLAGSAGGTALPNDCGIVIAWRTINPSRRGRGRTFLCGFTAGQLAQATTSSPTQVTPSTAAGIALAAATLADNGAVPLQVYSRVNETGYSVTGGQVSRRWATQRRRDLETPLDPEPFTV